MNMTNMMTIVTKKRYIKMYDLFDYSDYDILKKMMMIAIMMMIVKFVVH